MLETRNLQCPYCWEMIEAVVDLSAGDQQYIEDCPVCCHPITFDIRVDETGAALVEAYGQEE